MHSDTSMRATCFEQYTAHIARARRGSFPKTVMLAAPHTNEHPAVLLPQYSLQRTLEANGIEVKTMNRIGMMGKLWRLRSALDREFPEDSRDRFVGNLLTSILSVRDLHERLQNMSYFFTNSPEGVFMEMHAMSEEVIQNSSLLSPEELRDFLQISGTNMLICREALRSLGESVAWARKSEIDTYSSIPDLIAGKFQQSVRDLLLAVKSRIEEMCGFSAAKAAGECEKLLFELKEHKDRISIVEIPSQKRELPPEHRMHKLYFQRRLVEEGYGQVSSSHFEEVYASCTRESAGFSQRDAEALLNQLKVC